MSEGLPDVPERFESRLSVNEDYRVQDHHLVAAFVESEAAFRSVSQVAAEVDMSTQGTRDRLDDLEELGVLDSRPGANGRIYWLADDRSEWPIPPDVAVEPVADDLTVAELLAEPAFKTGVAAVAAGLAGVVFFLAGFAVGLTLPSPEPVAVPLFLLSLLSGVGSLALGAASLGWWLLGD